MKEGPGVARDVTDLADNAGNILLDADPHIWSHPHSLQSQEDTHIGMSHAHWCKYHHHRYLQLCCIHQCLGGKFMDSTTYGNTWSSHLQYSNVRITTW